MGTTLTGTTPQNTYDSLIKVTDNGPLSGSLKTLTDGLGNDSALALSTGAASVTGTLAVSGNSTFDTTTLVVDAAGDRVILGAAAALQGDTIEIHAKSNSGAISIFGRASDNGSAVSFRSNGATTQKAQIYGSDAGLGFATGTTQRVLIDSSGNVGIGTSAPAYKLEIFDGGGSSLAVGASTGKAFLYADNNGATLGAISAIPLRFNINGSEVGRFLAGGGLTFNGDTAAANALDDYEEGTWTPNFTLNAGSVSAYTSSGSYTKIGRQVSVTLSLVFTTTSSAQVDTITGLPFTAENTAQTAIGAVRENSNTGDMWHWRVSPNATSGVLRRYDNNIALANGDSFIGTLTYFV